jgi:hypothetical protein
LFVPKTQKDNSRSVGNHQEFRNARADIPVGSGLFLPDTTSGLRASQSEMPVGKPALRQHENGWKRRVPIGFSPETGSRIKQWIKAA